MIVPIFDLKLSKNVYGHDTNLPSLSVVNRQNSPVVLIGLSESNHATIDTLKNYEAHLHRFPNDMPAGKQKPATGIQRFCARHAGPSCPTMVAWSLKNTENCRSIDMSASPASFSKVEKLILRDVGTLTVENVFSTWFTTFSAPYEQASECLDLLSHERVNVESEKHKCR